MTTKRALVVVVGLFALFALVAVVFVLVFRSTGMLDFEGPFGLKLNLGGQNAPAPRPGAINAEDLKAGKDLRAHGNTGGDVEVKRAAAQGNIDLSTEPPARAPDPKQ
jgi:hypothetical protein